MAKQPKTDELKQEPATTTAPEGANGQDPNAGVPATAPSANGTSAVPAGKDEPGHDASHEPRDTPERAVVVEETGGMTRRKPTAQEIAEALPDPILFLETVVILANSDRFRRNGPLMQIAQHYQVEQRSIAEMQERIDQRTARKAAEAEAAADE